MPSVVISHLICTTALIILILFMPVFYNIIVNDILEDTIQRELKEIANYVANTLENLYFLANSTNIENLTLEKKLIYLPSYVENEVFVVEVVGAGENSSKISVYLKDKPWISADSWLYFPGLRVGTEHFLESGRGMAVAWCSRSGQHIYIGVKVESN